MSSNAAVFLSNLSHYLPQGMKWRCEGILGNFSVTREENSSFFLVNLIDFLHVINSASQTIQNYGEALNKNLSISRKAYCRLHAQAVLIDRHLQNTNSFFLLVYKVCSYICESSTFSEAACSLRLKFVNATGVSDVPTMLCLSLLADAKEALKSKESYNRIAGQYQLAPDFRFFLTNPILWHLKYALTSRWLDIEKELKEGKTIDHPCVAELCDSAMETLNVLGKLIVKRELEALINSHGIKVRGKALSLLGDEKIIKGILMSTQSGWNGGKQLYPWVLYTTIQSFYRWLRSMPSYHSFSRKWNLSAASDFELSKRFYNSGERHRQWAFFWNDFIEELEAETDITALLEQDHRYYTTKDDPEIFEAFQRGVKNDFLTHVHSSSLLLRDEGPAHHISSGLY